MASTPNPAAGGRGALVAALAVSLFLARAACDVPGRGYGVHRVRVDAVVVPDTVPPGVPVEIRVIGVVGTSSCDVLDRIERIRTETTVSLKLWTRHPQDDACTRDPVLLDTTLVEPAPAADSLVIVVRGTDEHRRTVQVRRPPPPRTGVRLYFHRGDTLASVTRQVRDTPAILRTTLMELLEGPTTEEHDAGLRSFFSERTAGLLHNATVNDGFAVVDLDERLVRAIPGASASAGGRQLLEELNATVFQFPAVDSVQYRLGGSCDAFWGFLQYACQTVHRSGTAL